MSLVGSGGSLTWDGNNLSVSGAVNATTGNFSGYVTAGGVQLGAALPTNPIGSGTANGLYINANNYWVDNGTTTVFKAGGSSNYISWDGSTTLSVVGDVTATSGYISNTFAIGSSASPRIFLDASTSNRKLYIGTGTVNNWNTPFYVDTNGQFSLGAGLYFYPGSPVGTGATLDLTGAAVTAAGLTVGSLTTPTSGTYVNFDFNMPVPYGSGYGFIVYGGYSGAVHNAYVQFNSIAGTALFDKNGKFTISDIYVTGGSIAGGSITGISSFSCNGTGYFGGILSGGSSATFVGDVTANTSDKRLKTNVRKIDNALEKVSQINGVYYNFTDEALKLNHTLDKKEQVGLLAQEVQSVLPHIIKPAPFDIDRESGESISGENYLTIQYEKIVPLLLEAIKELKAEVEELKRNK
jgi:hypothetical protein